MDESFEKNALTNRLILIAKAGHPCMVAKTDMLGLLQLANFGPGNHLYLKVNDGPDPCRSNPDFLATMVRWVQDKIANDATSRCLG